MTGWTGSFAPTCPKHCRSRHHNQERASASDTGNCRRLRPALLARNTQSRVARCSAAAVELGPVLNEQIEAVPDRDSLVELGTFGPTHGVVGELKLQASTDSLEDRLSQQGPKWAVVQHPRRKFEPRPLEVEGFRETVSKGRETWLIKVKGVDSPEEAQGLRGHTLMMLAEDRPSLDDEDEFYVQELIGMQVLMHSSKEAVGMVTDVYDGTGTHDIIRIAMSSRAGSAEDGHQRSALVPFAKEIVPIVDRTARILEIDPPDGLLDIPSLLRSTSTKKKKRRRRKQQSTGDHT